MSALWIARVTVTDPEAYGKYAEIATEAITAHGGVFLVRGGKMDVLEGEGRARNVVARFPSLAAARACYDSPRYREALAFAKDAATRDVIVVEEL